MLASQNRHADQIKKREKKFIVFFKTNIDFSARTIRMLHAQTEVQTEIQIEFKLNSIQIQ